MNSTSRRAVEDYGLARVRDVAFDAVQKLWRRRRDAGATQKDLAAKLGRDPGWVSRQFKGPGNWTFRSFGALVEALDGEVEIVVHAIEDPIEGDNGFDAYRHEAGRHNEFRGGLVKVARRGDAADLRRGTVKRHRVVTNSVDAAAKRRFVASGGSRAHG